MKKWIDANLIAEQETDVKRGISIDDNYKNKLIMLLNSPKYKIVYNYI